jgi:sialate O-acetylesterase
MKIQTGLTDGQVLQRQGKKGAFLQLRGTCGQTGLVYATISDQRRCVAGWKKIIVGKAAHGRFAVSLAGIPAGGPYRLDLQAEKEAACVKAFFVGDVWLLAGQSNMEGVGNMPHAPKTHPLIRSFSLAREWVLAKDPLHVKRESSDACHSDGPPFSPAEAREFRRQATKGVGVGVFFAREMLQRSGVPQGLICTAHGATSMTQWDAGRKNEGAASFYGSMLLAVKATGQPVAGVLWYQGESDACESDKELYTERTKRLVAATRRDLRQPSLPWIAVQIGRVFDGRTEVAAWNDLQEQQRLLPDKIKNLELLAAIDLPLDDGIHLASAGHARLAARLAHMADYLVYGNKKEIGAPRLQEIRCVNVSMNNPLGMGPDIDVEFDHVAGGLQASGAPEGFTLVTADGQVWPCIYKTTLHGSIARLHVARPLPDGAKLHYGHGMGPVCNITDGRGLSLPVFGPLPLPQGQTWLPYVTSWRVTDVIPPPSDSLAKLACPDFKTFKTTVKAYGPDGLVNEHPQWVKKSGHAYFSAQLELPEPMKLQFSMGYDGPFRLWLDTTPIFTDLKGMTPNISDQGSVTLALKARRYRLTVAMDINRGRAIGFTLRFLRRDVSKAQIEADTFRRPLYSV